MYVEVVASQSSVVFWYTLVPRLPRELRFVILSEAALKEHRPLCDGPTDKAYQAYVW